MLKGFLGALLLCIQQYSPSILGMYRPSRSISEGTTASVRDSSKWKKTINKGNCPFDDWCSNILSVTVVMEIRRSLLPDIAESLEAWRSSGGWRDSEASDDRPDLHIWGLDKLCSFWFLRYAARCGCVRLLLTVTARAHRCQWRIENTITIATWIKNGDWRFELMIAQFQWRNVFLSSFMFQWI